MPSEVCDKHDVRARFVKLLRHIREDRGMTLIPERSRCVLSGQLHEIVLTDTAPAAAYAEGEVAGFMDDAAGSAGDVDAAVGARIDRVGFLGFAEIMNAGVIDRGDHVHVGGRRIGRVLGFDACHFPNHYNIIIHAPRLGSATELSLSLHDEIVFKEVD